MIISPQKRKKTLRDKKLTLKMWVINEEQVYNPAPIKNGGAHQMGFSQSGSGG